MRNQQIKEILLRNGVNHLYHTNTVETSISFLKHGGLISRGVCEDKGYPQTYQYTDDLDKRYGIFYDIFFDSTEIQRKTGLSYYGPVLFVYSIDVLDTIEEGHIRITKKNPKDWDDTGNENERYFMNIDELSGCFDKTNFGYHTTLTDQKKPLPFNFLKKIVLSDPLQSDDSLFKTAHSEIRKEIEKNNYNIPVEVRDYNYNNYYIDFYKKNYNCKKHFGLGGHTK